MSRDKQSADDTVTASTGTDVAPKDDYSAMPDAKEALAWNDDSSRMFDDDALASITDLDGALRLLAESDAPVESITDYGNGFTVVTEKRTLIGVPFVIVQWRFNDGDNGVFVSFAAVTEDGRKVIVNDGSTGICSQLDTVTKQRKARNHAHPQAGLLCKGGLRVSDYTYDGGSGKDKAASTFYLAQ